MSLSIAVLGSGDIAEHHLKSIAAHPNIQLKGIYTRNITKLKALSEQYACHSYSSIDEVMNDQELDILDICNKNVDHFPHAYQGLKHGKHVLIEKPIAFQAQEVQTLIELSHQVNKQAGVVFQKRYGKAYQHVKPCIEQYLNEAKFSETKVHMPRDPSYYESPYKKNKKYAGGGVLFYQAIHNFDLLIQLFGKVQTDHIHGYASNINHDIEVEDSCDFNMTFESGMINHFMASTANFLPPQVNTIIYGSQHFLFFSDREIKVYKNDQLELLQQLIFPKKERLIKRLSGALKTNKKLRPVFEYKNGSRGAYHDVLNDFYQSIQNPNHASRCKLESSLETHRSIEFIYRDIFKRPLSPS